MHILIVRNNSNSQAVDASLLLATYLATQGLDYTLVDSSDLSCRCDHEELNGALASGVEMAVVLGGDGTILRTARQIGTSGVPVLGINFGRLGFLANTGDEGVIAVVASALAGDVVAEQRTNLRIDVVCEGEPDPWGDDDEAAAHDVDDSRWASRARTSPTCAATGWWWQRPPDRRLTRCRRAGRWWLPASTAWWPCRWRRTPCIRALS